MSISFKYSVAITLLLILLHLPSLAQEKPTDSSIVAKIIGNDVKMLSEADITSKHITLIPSHSEVIVVDFEDVFYKIKYGKFEGWLHKLFVVDNKELNDLVKVKRFNTGYDRQRFTRQGCRRVRCQAYLLGGKRCTILTRNCSKKCDLHK